MNRLIKKLIDIQIIKYGDFTLKSGVKSNIYVDFRSVISYPEIFTELSYHLSKLIDNTKNDVTIAGVPMGAIPISVKVADILNTPLIMLRNEQKEHGTKNMIEGNDFNKDIILIEDVVTSGSSVLKAIKLLESQNKKIRKIVVILDREDNIKKFKDLGYDMVALFTLNDLVNIKNTEKVYNNRTQKILEIINYKKSNLIASIDFTEPDQIIKLIETIGNYVCGIKLHLDMIDFTRCDGEKFMRNMLALKTKHNIFVIEDRKYADIPMITGLQVDQLPYFIDIVTVHGITGELIIEELNRHNIGILLIHKLSSQDNLIDTLYSKKIESILDKYYDTSNIIGVISQEKISDQYLTFSPGINLDTTTDNIGQTYKKPGNHGDLFIVGRGIYTAEDPLDSVKKYHNMCWKYYNKN